MWTREQKDISSGQHILLKTQIIADFDVSLFAPQNPLRRPHAIAFDLPTQE